MTNPIVSGDQIILTDGAMGTYYGQITGEHDRLSEWANIGDPDTITGIHKAYLEAGANLIRTNTFSANPYTLNTGMIQVEELIVHGIHCARKAAMRYKNATVAASIGPIPENLLDGTRIEKQVQIDCYHHMMDIFMKQDMDSFFLETFSSMEIVSELAKYIRQGRPEAFIAVQLTIAPDGYTRKGIGLQRVVDGMVSCPVDAIGFNCGIGPGHLLRFMEGIDFRGRTISALPNAGYPEIIHERTVYTNTPEYFAQAMLRIRDLGVSILGGCCGTTPKHIAKLREALDKQPMKSEPKTFSSSNKAVIKPMENIFVHKLNTGGFPIAVEVDPPFDAQMEKVVHAALSLRASGADIVTIADSPMARARMDSMMTAARIKRETRIDTMPHLCCRDKNMIALKAGILAAHAEGIRNILAVTGDPIPNAERNEIRSVFNLNSYALIELIREMNREIFKEDPIWVGGALNLNVLRQQGELNRMEKKSALGASYYLTQPIFDASAIPWLKKAKEQGNAKVLAGILPLVSYRNAMFLNNEIPGIKVPQDVIDSFHPEMAREEAEAIGIAAACKLIDAIRPYIDGLYLIMPFNRTGLMRALIHYVRQERRLEKNLVPKEGNTE